MNTKYGLSEKISAMIQRVFSQHPEIDRAILFGSRAKGTFKSGSDIDLALIGQSLTQKTLHRLYEELDDLPIPYEFSLVLSDKVTDPDVAAHIKRVGIVFYEKEKCGLKDSDVKRDRDILTRHSQLIDVTIPNGTRVNDGQGLS